MKWGILGIIIIFIVVLGIIKRVKKLFLLAAFLLIAFLLWNYLVTGSLPHWLKF